MKPIPEDFYSTESDASFQQATAGQIGTLVGRFGHGFKGAPNL
jgi:hypothetical protein